MSCVCTHINFRVFTKKKRGNNTDDAKSYHSRCKKVAHNHTKQLCSIFRIKPKILGFNNQVRNFRTSKAQGAGNSGLPRSFRTSRNTHRKTGNSEFFWISWGLVHPCILPRVARAVQKLLITGAKRSTIEHVYSIPKESLSTKRSRLT